jgi:aflatoxin B1 aldehyde reductase
MVIDICENNGELSIKPHVYQGMYNIYCRRIEELFPTFSDYKIHFECYNPLAGGLLTGKWANEEVSSGRFSDNPIYKSIFWNDALVKETSLLNADISLRWLRYYSRLRGSDSIIIGCSNEDHLLSNVESLNNSNPLSSDILIEIERFWQMAKSVQPNYYY